MDIEKHRITEQRFNELQDSDMREFAFVSLPHSPHRGIDAWSHDGTGDADIDGTVAFWIFEDPSDSCNDLTDLMAGRKEWKSVDFYAVKGAEEAKALLVALVLHYSTHANNDV